LLPIVSAKGEQSNMVVVTAMLAFLIGTTAASLVVVVVLSDSRNEVYWSFVNRHDSASNGRPGDQ
jgi:hypothetical protein